MKYTRFKIQLQEFAQLKGIEAPISVLRVKAMEECVKRGRNNLQALLEDLRLEKHIDNLTNIDAY